MKKGSKDVIVLCLILISLITSLFASDIGYRVTKAEGYKKLRSNQKSTLYEVIAPELDDNRPIKLLDLHGSHYQAGYDYGFLLSD